MSPKWTEHDIVAKHGTCISGTAEAGSHGEGGSTAQAEQTHSEKQCTDMGKHGTHIDGTTKAESGGPGINTAKTIADQLR